MSQASPTTSPLFHISRNFVEFGTFTSAEIASFKQRGILRDHDYVRADKETQWTSLGVWLADNFPAIGESPKKKPAAKKRPAATKSSKKAA